MPTVASFEGQSVSSAADIALSEGQRLVEPCISSIYRLTFGPLAVPFMPGEYRLRIRSFVEVASCNLLMTAAETVKSTIH